MGQQQKKEKTEGATGSGRINQGADRKVLSNDNPLDYRQGGDIRFPEVPASLQALKC